MEGLISVNGLVEAPDKASIPALDRGFLFGDSVFETLVGFQNQVLDVEPHLERLRRSAEEIELDIPWSNKELSFEITGLCEQLACEKKNIRLVVTRGLGLGLKTPEEQPPQKIIFCFPAIAETISTYSEGVSAKRRSLPYTLRGAAPKTSNYLRSIVALRQAAKEGFQEIIWSNADGELTESTAANLFLIGRDGDSVEIATPPATSGLLLGITRATLMELLNAARIPVTERVIYADEIPRFDEAFICSTVRGLVPLKKIDQHTLHTMRPNSVYRHIERLYLSYVEMRLGYRVDWNSGKIL